jgi:hypothetical protein
MVEIIYKNGTSEIVPQILLKGILYAKRAEIKTHQKVKTTKSEAGLGNNYLKRGCLIR